jgi:hypothetical protein
MRRTTFAQALTILLGTPAAFWPSIAGADSASPPTLSQLDLLGLLDVVFLQKLANSVRPAPSGAVGENQASFDQVGVQNQSSFVVPDALVERNREELDNALKVLEFGYAHMRPDGSFEYADTGRSGAPPTALTQDSSAAFLMYDTGHSLCLLRESSWFQSDPDVADERQRVAVLETKARTAITRLVSEADVLRTDRLAVNRTINYAMAYYLNGKALNHADALAAGRNFIDNALGRQTAAGVFTENSGFDSSYQGVSLFHAQVLLLEMLPEDEALRKRLWSGVVRGMQREMETVQADGTVGTVGNTRVSAQGERVFGVTKSIDTRSVSLALMYYAYATGDQNLQRTARAVAARYALL